MDFKRDGEWKSVLPVESIKANCVPHKSDSPQRFGYKLVPVHTRRVRNLLTTALFIEREPLVCV